MHPLKADAVSLLRQLAGLGEVDWVAPSISQKHDGGEVVTSCTHDIK